MLIIAFLFDEEQQSVSNLCSAYSYCLSLLGAIYVWHGRGATEDERKVALTYGQSLTRASSGVVEFEEGKEDEMFWMVLGDSGYANADHWKFKGQLDSLGARLHVVDCSKVKSPVSPFIAHSFALSNRASLGASPPKRLCPGLTR
jgi:hypothetical protein